jgi:hypothetical protein
MIVYLLEVPQMAYETFELRFEGCHTVKIPLLHNQDEDHAALNEVFQSPVAHGNGARPIL